MKQVLSIADENEKTRVQQNATKSMNIAENLHMHKHTLVTLSKFAELLRLLKFSAKLFVVQKLAIWFRGNQVLIGKS